MLSRVLFDTFTLGVKTRLYHWNVKDERVDEHQQLFNQKLDHAIDTIAERIRSIGHATVRLLQAFLALIRLHESLDDEPGFNLVFAR